jgi:hypothetical protein
MDNPTTLANFASHPHLTSGFEQRICTKEELKTLKFANKGQISA